MIKHSIANYPLRFFGYVVSPTKICLQFEDVFSKLRFKQGADYIKMPDTIKALPIKITGTDVDILAVGCQLPVIEELQRSLIAAYVEYGTQHSNTYLTTYGQHFTDFLLDIQQEIDNAIHQLKAKGDRTHE